MTRHSGGCHCGALTVEFETDKPLAPRACQCSFCRERRARWVSDPGGSARLTIRPETVRYRFGTGTADFVICSRCGSCLAAVQQAGSGSIAVLNLNAFDDPHDELEGEPMDFDGETVGTRTDRRKAHWTRIEIIER
jgi:hypothetical protein